MTLAHHIHHPQAGRITIGRRHGGLDTWYRSLVRTVIDEGGLALPKPEAAWRFLTLDDHLACGAESVQIVVADFVTELWF
jgi:hypothetical protein